MPAKSRRRFPVLADFSSAALRGTPGFFRLGRTGDGVWWWLTPEDHPVVLRAVAGVNRYGRAGPPPDRRSAYATTLSSLYGEDHSGAWERGTAARLHTWGVDTIGPWADLALVDRGFYFTALADFVRAAVPTLHGPGVRLPDVFDPRWPVAAEAHAMAVAPGWSGRRELVGWFTDDGLGWGDTHPGRVGLLQVCLSLEPSFAAHHAAWEFVLAANGGSLEGLGRAWGLPFSQREHLRQRTRADQPIEGATFAEDARRFAQELARRYFSVAGRCLRSVDPSHLVLGCRFSVPPSAGVREACILPDVDVVSWRFQADAPARKRFDAAKEDAPQWVTGGGLSHADFRALPVRDGTGPTRLERLLRASREAFVGFCRDPRTVGLEWAHWADSGQDTPPFGAGLVHADDREAVEHTELIAHIHARARLLHLRGPGAAGRR